MCKWCNRYEEIERFYSLVEKICGPMKDEGSTNCSFELSGEAGMEDSQDFEDLY